MRTSLPTPALGQENVALASKRCELLLDGPHPLSNLGDSALDLCVVESAEVISHHPCRRRRMRKAAAAITNKIPFGALRQGTPGPRCISTVVLKNS
jgi:hypothetical protein